jgi:hypothetical protein
MPDKISKQKFWDLYHKLPVELQDALFDDELWENVVELCNRYQANEDLDLMSDGLKDVLLGILPPNDYIDGLAKNLKTDKTTANRIIHEINRFILFPVKEALEEVYNLEMTPLAGAPSPNASAKSAYQEPIG